MGKPAFPVIVTRPSPQGARTARALEGEGHKVLHLPLFSAVHLPEAAATALATIGGGLVVTSAEVARVLGTLPEQVQPWLDQPVHAVGNATARAMADLGFLDVRSAGGNGADLAARLIATAKAGDLPLLYLAGEPRHPALEDALRQAHVPMVTVLVYRMIPDAGAAQRLKAASAENSAFAVLLYSREAALRFVQLMRESNQAAESVVPHCYCLSRAIADALPPSWQTNAVISAEASEESLLSLLPSPRRS